MIPSFFKPVVLHIAHVPSTIPGSDGQATARIVSALSTPFVLEGLFSERMRKLWTPSQTRSPPLVP
jgi:hypothetical protein